ncbi:Beta-lactamase-like protein [Lysobacter dokdonensis DS-58]|uniref:Beta-lactamase-like protein n=1 Tax=Lysobacter dokdonensis DS-58 TaxID=1300345 RepID=A0A0A2WHV4_9GAMM|nr:MBL fold metallo-hydrolase [Lysobacter dokdonensis]KGQ19761.1 Beta-lactamase-like protein [Lysobacter dokdonensis DS-58]
MTPWICATCATQYAPSHEPPSSCPVCEDDRQYVDWAGQRWTTLAELQRKYPVRIGEDAGLLAIDIPGFAIPQRLLHLKTDGGNILWESLGIVTDEAVAALQANGGVDCIVVSHPHFYSSMIEWSEALGGVGILLHDADREWVRRPSPNVKYWRGDTLSLSNDVTLINVAGHFPGSTALHWKNGPRGQTLFPGDAPHVGQDRKSVSFMHSVPNFTPMKPSAVRRMRELLAPYDYDDVYGFSWGRNILGNGRAAVEASFDRFLQQVAA